MPSRRGDRRGGGGLVARDHHGPDARAPALEHGLLRLGARRVLKADQPEEGEAAFGRVVGSRQGIRLLFRHGEHAQRVLRHLGVAGEDAPAQVARERQRLPAAFRRRAALQKQVGRALHDHAVAAFRAQNHAHALTLRGERDLPRLDAPLEQRLEIRRRRRDGGFGRRADQPVIFKLHRCTERGGGEQALGRRLFEQARAVGTAHHGHLVLRQRAGLIGADHLTASERLHRLQMPDDRPLRRHTAHAEREDDRDDRRKPLGDRRDREADRYHKHLERIDALDEADRKERRADADDQKPDELAGFAQARLERRIGRFLLAEHRGDSAHFGFHARGGHHADAVAGRNARAGKEHVFPLRRAGLFRAEGTGRFRRRHRFTGQRAFFRVELRALEQAQVSRHDVARFELHNVARHERIARKHRAPAVAQDGRVRRGHRAQRLERVLGLRFLHRADQRVRHHDAEDQQRIGEIGLALYARRGERNRRRAEQNQHHEIAEL